MPGMTLRQPASFRLPPPGVIEDFAGSHHGSLLLSVWAGDGREWGMPSAHLPGTGVNMNYRIAGNCAVMAVAACLCAPAYAADASDDQRSDIVVTGQRVSSQAGTKSDVPVAETPQSISVITSGDVADLGLANLNQALRFVAGVTPEQRGAAAEVYDQFKLRGFDAPIYLDGLKLFTSATGYASPQIDVSRLDRIEIIKGPASVLYGQSSPGGLVAQSSKLPIDHDLYGAVSATYGTYNLYRADADLGGRIGKGALWRIYGSVNGADTQKATASVAARRSRAQ